MRKLTTLLVTAAALTACAAGADPRKSCAELAQAQAAEQMERETALLEQQELGHPNKSVLQRDFIAIDAEAYRAATHEECLRRRGLAPEDS